MGRLAVSAFGTPLHVSLAALSVVAAVGIGGCAAPARVEQMSISASDVSNIATPPELRSNVAIHDVTGGKETNPMWMSNVGSAEFEQALEASLRAGGMLAPSRAAGKYMLTAHLEKLDQPAFGVNFTVTATVQYTLSERATGKDVFIRKVTTPYTASFGDAVLGVERLKLANEGAIRANIAKFLEDMAKQKFALVGHVHLARMQP